MPGTLTAANKIGAGAGQGLAGVGLVCGKKLETPVRGNSERLASHAL
jgi:hypothetical protein